MTPVEMVAYLEMSGKIIFLIGANGEAHTRSEFPVRFGMPKNSELSKIYVRAGKIPLPQQGSVIS